MNIIPYLKNQHIDILVRMVFEPLDVIKAKYPYTFPIKKFYQEARLFLFIAGGIDKGFIEEKVEAAMRYMANRSNKDIQEIELEMQERIIELAVACPEYSKIKPDGTIPNAKELLHFFYEKYPEPFIILPYGYVQYL